LPTSITNFRTDFSFVAVFEIINRNFRMIPSIPRTDELTVQLLLGLTLEPEPGQAVQGVSYERAYPIESLALIPPATHLPPRRGCG
jgi:nucleoside permease NupC